MAEITKVPTTVPGNMKGTLAGLAATIATAALAKTGIYASVITFLGSSSLVTNIISASLTGLGITVASTQPEVLLATAVSVGIGYAVNYGVTHFSGIKKCADLYSAIPNTYAEYPGDDKPKSMTTTNLKTKDGNCNSGK